MPRFVGATDQTRAKAVKLRLISQDLADTAKDLAISAGKDVDSEVEVEWIIRNHLEDIQDVRDIALCIRILWEIEIHLDVLALKLGQDYDVRKILKKFFLNKDKWAGYVDSSVEW